MNGTPDATDGLGLGAPPDDQCSPSGHPGGLRASCRTVDQVPASLRVSAFGRGHGTSSLMGEGYQNDDPSRSDRVVLMDEPADEIPAPDLGDLIDRGDRGPTLRDG